MPHTRIHAEKPTWYRVAALRRNKMFVEIAAAPGQLRRSDMCCSLTAPAAPYGASGFLHRSATSLAPLTGLHTCSRLPASFPPKEYSRHLGQSRRDCATPGFAAGASRRESDFSSLTFRKTRLACSMARRVEKNVPQSAQMTASVSIPFPTARWCIRAANSFSLTPAGQLLAHSSQVKQYQNRASPRSARASSAGKRANAMRLTIARGNAKYGRSSKTSGSGQTAEHTPHCRQNLRSHWRTALRIALARERLRTAKRVTSLFGY